MIGIPTTGPRGWARFAALNTLAAATVALAIPAVPAHGQARTVLVVGVADASSGAPIPDAEISVPSISRRVRTNWLGEARISGINSGVYEVRVRRVGFVSADLNVLLEGDSSGVTFMLEKAPISLDTVHVRATEVTDALHADFEMRRRMGLGRFMDRQDLAREKMRDFALVAVSHFPGLTVVPGPGGRLQLASLHGSCGVDTTHEAVAKNRLTGLSVQGQQTQQIVGEGSGSRQQMGDATSSPSSCFSTQPCHVKLFLDDMPVAETDIDIVHTDELYGVEYYAIGNAPPRYRTAGSACGVMLLWSRYDSGG